MSVGYRSVLTLGNADDAVSTASDQFRSWLLSKKLDKRGPVRVSDWDGPGVHQLGKGVTLTVVAHVGEDGSRRQLLQLVEENRYGKWTTRLLAHSLAGVKSRPQALWIETTGEASQGKELVPSPPRLVGQILEAVDVFDGSVPVLPRPELIDLGDVDRLLGYLRDDDRNISVVVAAPIASVPIDRWQTAVAGLVKDSVGCASAFVLTEAAHARLNDELSSSHTVPSNAVRTFLPGIDETDSADSVRHRVLGARTMSRLLSADGRFGRRLVAVHSISARVHLRESALPTELSRSERLLEREALGQARAAIESEFSSGRPADVEPLPAEPEPEPDKADQSADAAWLRRLRKLVKKVFGSSEIGVETVERLDKELQSRAKTRDLAEAQLADVLNEKDLLDDEIARLRRELEWEQLERALAEEERRAAEKAARDVLRWKNEQKIAVPIVDSGDLFWEEPPQTVSDLVERFIDTAGFEEVARYVEMTDLDNAIDRAAEIDERDKLGRYAAHFWEYVLILRDYVIACQAGFEGGVHLYLKDSRVDGRKCSERRHKPTESDAVQSDARMRKARLFPVPPAVHKDGRVHMWAHFAPTHRDTSAPRMHYYPDVANTGKVYIGYIGRHLLNTKTN